MITFYEKSRSSSRRGVWKSGREEERKSGRVGVKELKSK